MSSDASFEPSTAGLRSRLPPGLRAAMRRKQGRLRWIYKYRRARSFGHSIRGDPAMMLGFVLLDPEVGNFTYELENEAELAPFLAAAVDAPADEIRRRIEEAREDPELNHELSRRLRFRWDFKRRMPLGRRLGWFALVRALRPATVVETGIQHGLGSLALLRALELNAEEGDDGELISFDVAEGAGSLVPARLRERWRPVYESTLKSLDRELAGRSVEMMISDLGAGYEIELHDYEAAARHAANRLVLVAGSAHLSSALADFAAAGDLAYHEFAERPHRHVFPGARSGIAVLRADGGGSE